MDTNAKASKGPGSLVGDVLLCTSLLLTLHTSSLVFTKSSEAAVTVLSLQVRSWGSEKVNDLPKLAKLERGSGRTQTEDVRLQSSSSFP